LPTEAGGELLIREHAADALVRQLPQPVHRVGPPLRCTNASITRWLGASLSTMKSIGRGRPTRACDRPSDPVMAAIGKWDSALD
jgi:hypothetical protein